MLYGLLKNLEDSNPVVHNEALRQARRLPPERLLRLLDLEAEQSRRQQKAHLRFFLAFVTACLLLTALGKLLTPKGLQDLSMVGVFCLMTVGPGLWLGRNRVTRAHTNLANIMAETDDPRFLGPILNILAEDEFSEGEQPIIWKPNMDSALKRILVKVRPSEAGALTEMQKKTLLALLGMPYNDVELTVCTLKALEQIGDESAIPVVEKLANIGAITRNMRRVRDAAQECLPYLQRRAEQAIQAQTLLRAANVEVTASEELLRAATTSEPTAPEQLLRSTHSIK